MEDGGGVSSRASLAGGRLLAEISLRMVKIQREHYGRGPLKAKTYALDDLILVVLRGIGFTTLEQTQIENGHPGRVVTMRQQFRDAMSRRYKETIEELTGRQVVAFVSQSIVEPDITIHGFIVDAPAPGFGCPGAVRRRPDRLREA